jgi:4-amino-4-deoxy-L-arabinose transferase-like glycosyltransferase
MYTMSRDSVPYQARGFPNIRISSLWIPIFYAVTLIALSPFHSTFDEWGGVMQYFSGREILAGMGYHGYASYFWPPLFSFLMGAGSLILPGFLVGKLISILSASALLFVAFHLAQEISGRKGIGWWAQVFLILSPIYVFQSFLAANHMLESLFFVTGLYLFLRSLRDPQPGKLLIAGLMCGLAGLSRYTSYVLLALPFFIFILKPGFGRAIKSAVAFWIGFTLISLPWWYTNTMANGSPLYSMEHLNVCTSIIAHNPGSNHSLWECVDQNINGIVEIVAAYPLEYVKNFGHNIYQSTKLLVDYAGALAPFVLPAIFESIFLIKSRHWITIFGVLSFSVVLVSQAFLGEWYLLSWIVPITIVTVLFVLKYSERIVENFPVLNKYYVRQLFLGLLVVAGLILTCSRLVTSLTAERSYLPLKDVKQVAQALKEHDPDLKSKVVMAIDPSQAYYAGSKYLITPFDYEGTLEDMVAYQGLSEQVKNFAPKYPSSWENSDLRADYLIYTNAPVNLTEEYELPQFSFLLDPQSDSIPTNFELVVQSPNVVAYEIHW